MAMVEIEVQGKMPPRNIGKRSMWNNKTEVPRVIELRKRAYEAFKGNPPLSVDIRLEIEIHIPKNHNKPGDLDNFVKGICDCLCIPKKALIHPQFKPHEDFELSENYDIHPRRFAVIEDDEAIVEIKATKVFEELTEPYYRIRIEGTP